MACGRDGCGAVHYPDGCHTDLGAAHHSGGWRAGEPDVETLANWYCDVLGYQKWFRHEKPVWMLRAPDNTLLEIMPKDDTARPERTTWTPGWSHIVLRVADIDQAVASLDTKGVTWGGDVINAIGGGRVRNFFDPDGNMLQILQRANERESA